MKKFDVAYTETRRMVITIEANSENEAVELFTQRMRNDDYFCDEVAERLENGVIDEETNASEIEDFDDVDYTYAEMTEYEEE